MLRDNCLYDVSSSISDAFTLMSFVSFEAFFCTSKITSGDGVLPDILCFFTFVNLTPSNLSL